VCLTGARLRGRRISGRLHGAARRATVAIMAMLAGRRLLPLIVGLAAIASCSGSPISPSADAGESEGSAGVGGAGGAPGATGGTGGAGGSAGVGGTGGTAGSSNGVPPSATCTAGPVMSTEARSIDSIGENVDTTCVSVVGFLPWKMAATGATCTTPTDCSPVCVACPNGTHHALASWCNHGKCASPEAVSCVVLGTPLGAYCDR
jgi:hypothetical protein